MQVRGTFPELSAGRTKGKAKRPVMREKPEARSMFGTTSKVRALPKNPSTYAGRRAASHAKASR